MEPLVEAKASVDYLGQTISRFHTYASYKGVWLGRRNEQHVYSWQGVLPMKFSLHMAYAPLSYHKTHFCSSAALLTALCTLIHHHRSLQIRRHCNASKSSPIKNILHSRFPPHHRRCSFLSLRSNRKSSPPTPKNTYDECKDKRQNSHSPSAAFPATAPTSHPHLPP